MVAESYKNTIRAPTLREMGAPFSASTKNSKELATNQRIFLSFLFSSVKRLVPVKAEDTQSKWSGLSQRHFR